MILRRIASSLKRLDLVSFLIELLLVIAGVLAALQVNNWNEERKDQDGLALSLTRLEAEAKFNIDITQQQIDLINDRRGIWRSAGELLDSCNSTAEGAAVISQAVFELTADFVPSFQLASLDELSRQDRYLNQLSANFRTSLNEYRYRLTEIDDQLIINYGLMWDDHVVRLPVWDADLNLEHSANPLKLAVPVEELCKNTRFRAQFAITRAFVDSADRFSNDLLEVTERFVAEIQREQERPS